MKNFKSLAGIAALLLILMVAFSMKPAHAGTVSIRSAPESTGDEGQPRGDLVFGPFLYETNIVNGNTVHRFYDSETGVVCYLLGDKPWGCSAAPIRSVLDERYEGKDAK